jgi:hypothetical protein
MKILTYRFYCLAGGLPALLLGCFISVSTVSLADDKLELFYSSYSDTKGLDVKSPGVTATKDVDEQTTLGFLFIKEKYELIPPSGGGSVDSVSGASVINSAGTSRSNAFNEKREEYGVFGSQIRGDSTYGAGYFAGNEPDFKSESLSLSFDRGFLNNNLTLSSRLVLEHNDVYKPAATLDQGFPKDKEVTRLVLAATQLVSRTSLLVAGLSFENQDGFLSSPTRKFDKLPITGGFKSVDIDERHPDGRFRQVYFVRGKQYFQNNYFHQKSALDMNLSFYTDDWGVRSYSTELRGSQYLTPNIIGRLRYRYYSQSQADFYKTSYMTEEAIMTLDTKLREFDSKLYGIQLRYLPKLAELNNMSISLTYDRYSENNNGKDADIYQLSFIMPY